MSVDEPEKVEATALTPPAPEEAGASHAIGQALSDAARRAGMDPSDDATTGKIVWKAIGGRARRRRIGAAARGVPREPLGVARSARHRGGRLDRRRRDLHGGPTDPAPAPVSRARRSRGGGRRRGAGAVHRARRGQFHPRIHHERRLRVGVPDLRAPGLVADRARGRVPRWTTAWPGAETSASAAPSSGSRSCGRPCSSLRLGVQLPMWFADVDVQVLGTVKLVMGIPLFAPLVAVTWLVVRAAISAEERRDAWLYLS